MKRTLTLVLLLMLCTLAIAESAWTDGTFALGASGYTVYMPGNVSPVVPDEEGELAEATTEGWGDGEGGLTISIELAETENQKAFFWSTYHELSNVNEGNGFAVFDYNAGSNDAKWDAYQAIGNPCVKLYSGTAPVGPDGVDYMCAEMFAEGECLGMMAAAIIPDGTNVYTVVYGMNAEYVDTMDNLIAGTIAFE